MISAIFFLLMAAFVQDLVYPIGNTGLVGLTIQNIVLYCAAAILVAVSASTGRLRSIRIPGVMFLLMIALFVSVSVVYVSYAGAIPVSLLENARIAKTLIFEPILLYLISFLLVRNPRQGLKYLAIFVAIIGLINILTLMTSVFGLNPLNVGAHYLDKGRFAGLAGNPNKTAYVLCIVFAFIYFFMKKTTKRRVKIFYVILLAFIPITIVLTGSRGGVLGLLVVMIFLAKIWRDQKLLVYIPSIIGPIVFLLLWMTENEYLIQAVDRFFLLGADDLSTVTSSRTEIWSALFEIYLSGVISMFVGVGFGVVQFIGFGARAHSMYIQVLVEFGAIGLMVWLVGMWRSRRFVIRQRSADPSMEYLRRTILVCLYVVAIAWLFTSLIGVLGIIGMIFGLATATLILQVNRNQAVRGSR